MLQTKQSPILLGLGLEGFVRCLKIWNIDKLDKSGNPELLRCSRLTRQGSHAEAVSLAVSENLQLLAVGYDDGCIILHRGDVTKESRSTKIKVLLEKGHRVSGLSFRANETGTYLYVATTDDVIMFNVSLKDKESRVVLDTIGCPRGLCVSPQNFISDTHFVTGQQDAVYCYNPEGRGQCYAFEGKKRLIHWFKGYLTVITDEGLEKATLTVFDVQNRYIGFSAPIKPILAVVSEWGSIFVVSQDGKIHQLIEKDTQTKLEILFRKNFYDVAVKIAKNQHYDSEGLVDIFRQYGDHLYAKGDHPGAIDQYIKTIGVLEPSYIIQKFLDAQKIHNLTAYLQALHKKGLASEDHTTLLLNCYTKLKDSSKLDEFIMSKEGSDVDFDVDIAINVCRQAGYSKHALALAEKHHKHDLFLKIVIEQDADYYRALQYISSLSPTEAESQMQIHGSVLVKNVPLEFTEVLKKLIVTLREGGAEFNAGDYIHLFVSDQKAMVEFLDHLVTSGNQLNGSIYNTLLEYHLYAYKAADDVPTRVAFEKKIMDILKTDGDKYNVDQALVLCQLNNFQPGLLYLYQKSEMYEQILKHYFVEGDPEAGVNTCRRFGGQCPQLWVTALQSIAESNTTELPPHLFKEVLDNIESYRLLSPLQVVSTLSSCPTATLSVVRDYLLRTFGAEERAMEEDLRVIEQYKAESQKIRDKLEKMSNSVTIFQSTKCSACNHALDLPTVHFLCGHGYHQHCFQSFSDTDKDCPACAPENKKILDMLRSQELVKTQHDQFHAQLEKAEDGFSIVAEYLGRGLFEQHKPQPKNENSSKTNNDILANQMMDMNISEGRMRADERVAGQQAGTLSEARMRLADRSVGGQRPEAVPESRLRAGESSEAGVTIPSDARMRLAEHSTRNSLTANMTPVTRQSQYKAMSVSPQVPRREDIAQANPFKESKVDNPFGSPDSNESFGDDNPFAKQASPKRSVARAASSENPFGGEDNYDEEMNPFAE